MAMTTMALQMLEAADAAHIQHPGGTPLAHLKPAEDMLYFHASCARKASYPCLPDEDGLFVDRFTGTQFIPGAQQRRDFAELTAANELDLVVVSPDIRARYGSGLLDLALAQFP